MRLTDRLWGGVKLPALEHVQDLDLQPLVTYSSDPVGAEELFVSLLNDNQRKAWDKPWAPWHGYSRNWECKRIPVRGSGGGLWEIVLARDRNSGVPNLRAFLFDHNSRSRCFHAVENKRSSSSCGVNARQPFVAAIAFMTQLQANETWVRERAG